jgi:general secretion pathway protein A
MYTEYYQLREKPFSLSPDPRFLYLSASHREALAHVLYGIDQGEGFIAVTGEVGTGKTTLCRTLLERMGPQAEVAFLFNPSVSGAELAQAICVELGLPVRNRSRAALHDELNAFLLAMHHAGRRVLLIVDEAQNLTVEALEEIRLLSNLETATSKLIQIVLFGQPELDEQLDSHALRQLRQRISVRWRLTPLSAAESREYVRHRLRIAAGANRDLFTPAALREIRRRARGIPRLLNLLADRALLAGYASGADRVDTTHVSRAAREILSGGRRRRPQRFAGWRTLTKRAGRGTSR